MFFVVPGTITSTASSVMLHTAEKDNSRGLDGFFLDVERTCLEHVLLAVTLLPLTRHEIHDFKGFVLLKDLWCVPNSLDN